MTRHFLLAGLSWFFILVFIFGFYETPEEQEIILQVETPITIREEKSVVEETVDDQHLAAMECLALNIYHESRGDSLAGQAAVADVVLNRVDSHLFPNTICEVVKQAVYIENWKGNIVPKRHACHFSWYCDGVSDEPGDPDAWLASYAIAEEMVEGKWRGITDGATHYHAAHMRASWANDRGMKYRGTIGQHEFYKWH